MTKKMIADKKKIEIDIDAILASKLPNRRVPTLLKNYLKRIVHQEEINSFLASTDDRNVEFMKTTIYDHLKVKVKVEGAEKLPSPTGRYIFVSNHPLGGLDGIILGMILGEKYENKVKFFANDILMFLDPLKEMFLPVNKVGSQNRKYSLIIQDFFESDNHLVTFPAGACSRKTGRKIEDFYWRKTFISKSIQFQRDVIPIYFEGKNSNFFYNLANLRTKLGVKANIEMLYLVNEMYKQRGKQFTVKIGDRIPYQTFDKSKTHQAWATEVRDIVYAMK